MADKLGQVEMIEMDLQDGEQLIMPGNIEEAGFLNISRVRILVKLTNCETVFSLQKAIQIVMESTSIQLQPH